MANRTPPSSVSKAEMDVWCRTIGRRKAEWSSLPRNELTAVLRPMWNNEPSTPLLEDPWERTEWLLTRYFNVAVNRKVPAKERRSSWHHLNSLLKRLDEKRKSLTRNTENGSTNSEIHAPQPQISGSARAQMSNVVAASMTSTTTKTKTTTQGPPSIAQTTPQVAAESRLVAPSLHQKTVQSVPPNRSSTLDGNKNQQPVVVSQSSSSAHVSLSLDSSSRQSSSSKTSKDQPVANGVARHPQQQQEQLTRQRLLPVHQDQQQARAVTQSQKPTASRTATSTTQQSIPRATPELITAPKPVQKQKIGGMGSAFSSTTTKVAPALTVPNNRIRQTAPSKQTHRVAPPPPPPAQPLRPITIAYAADSKPRFTCSVAGRSDLRATFTPKTLSKEEYIRTKQRLDRWDPYWKTDHMISMVETYRISRCANLKQGTSPQQVTECTIALSPQAAQTVQAWGVNAAGTAKRYTHGETRLLVRMLPIRPNAVAAKKRPRADTHLWPKGTFVQLGGKPMMIQQRRQQNHAPTEWKGMSAPLDLTPCIADPTKTNKLQLYFLDNEPYVMCVALCRYNDASALIKAMWTENWIKTLTMEEAKSKALENANRHTVVLDDDDTSSNEASSFIFPLTCLVSQQLLETPVRGNDCRHWQCFDLRNFVESNSHVTGTRWECPVCSKLLSLRDLQYCPLTASVLKQYKGEAGPHRDRVQFFANGTWALLDEAKKRYSKKRPPDNETNVNGHKRVRTNGELASTRPRGSPEVIDLL